MKKIFTVSIFTFISLSFVPCIAQSPIFYGMTETGGTSNKGAIFSFDPGSNTESVVHSFGTGKDGWNSSATFVWDATRKLFFGTTFQGGNFNTGAIVSYDPKANIEDTVWSFGNGTDGSNSDGNNIVYDAAKGLYYGMTYAGGTLTYGTIFSFNPVTNSEVDLHNFGTGSDGTTPTGSLAFDPTNGLYYGMTNQGGTHVDGAIITFNPTTNAESVVYSFAGGADAKYPIGSLVFDASNGLFYGMTYGGGANGAALVSFNPGTNTEAVVHSFGGAGDGSVPDGNTLVYDATNSLFYGMIWSGGASGKGAIFSFNPTGNVEAVVHSFGTGTDGGNPMGDLVYYAGNGLYYGMTNTGGTANKGALISFNPTGNVEAVVHSFGTGTDGSSPHFANLALYTPPAGIDEVEGANGNIKVYPNPSTGIFNVVIRDKGKVISEIQVYDITGRKVFSQFLIPNSQFVIDISNQPAGMYFYKAIDNTGSLIGEGKVILQH